MKTQQAILAALLLVVSPAWAVEEPAIATLLQNGLYAEEAQGNLRSAIEIYQGIIAREDANRALVARAQFRLGACHRKLGELDAAVVAFRRVIDRFADQTHLVSEAQQQLVELQAQPGGITLREIVAPEGGLYALSRDGRLGAVFVGSGADLGVCDLKSGETRVIVPAAKGDGPWSGWRFSPDSRFLAYIWIGEPSLRITSLADPAPRILMTVPEGGWIEIADWTPDGAHVLVEMTRANQPAMAGLVAVKDGEFRELAQIREGAFGRMQFSPDGEWIACRPTKPSGQKSPGLFIMEVRTGAQFPVLKDYEADAVIGWAPRGRTLIYVRERVDESDLWAIDLSDPTQPGKPRLLKRHFRGEPLMITKSGDFYFVEKGRSSVDVQVARFDLSTGKMTEPPSAVAPEVPGVKSWPVWSPDGRRLGFSLEQQKVFCTWSPETEEVRQYPLADQLSEPLVFTRWAPDGARVLGWTASLDGDAGRYWVDLQTGRVERIVAEQTPEAHGRTWTGWFAGFGPDAGAFYYLAQEWRGPNEEQRIGQILRHDLTTAAVSLLTEWEQPWPHWPFEFSPGGRQCCLVTRADQGCKVRLMTLEGGGIRDLFTTDAWVQSLRWTHDGKRLVYVLERDWMSGEGTEVWSRALEGGEPVQLDLSLPRVRYVSVHPDDERLAFQIGKPEPDQVWVMQNLLPPSPEQDPP